MATLKTKDEMQNSFVDERVKVLLPQLEALAPYKPRQRERGVNDITGWQDLAVREASILKANYRNDEVSESEQTYSTCLRQISALKKHLSIAARTELKDEGNYYPVMTIITHFGNALSFLFREYKVQQNEVYRQKVTERSTVDNRVELDLTQYITKANDVLTKCFNGADLDELEWRDVSCALSLVTGRRMAEIHLSAEFIEESDYQVIFTGQLKGKGRKVEGQQLRFAEFKIPTLVRAELVVAGLNWLGEHGKRFPKSEDVERVNRRWNKVLSERVKEGWLILPSDEMTYHKFRGAFLRASLVNEDVDAFDYLDFAKSVLGDNDESTIKAYQRFKIKPGSVTQI